MAADRFEVGPKCGISRPARFARPRTEENGNSHLRKGIFSSRLVFEIGRSPVEARNLFLSIQFEFDPFHHSDDLS